MRRIIYRSYLAAAFAASFALCAHAQSSYTVLSQNPREVVISIHPNYTTRTVTDEKTGEKYERISFSGGSLSGIATGAPAAEWLPVDLIAPSKEPAKIEILKEEYASHSATLAPKPKWAFAKDEFKTPVEHYVRDNGSYKSYRTYGTYTTSANIFRTAYTQQLRIYPIQFDAAANSIKLEKEIIVKVTFPVSASQNISVSPSERELYTRLFANGTISQFYHSAKSEVTKSVSPNTISYKQNSTLGANDKWLMVSTNDQGVYHITAGDLSQAGISSADPSQIQLFGYGGATIPEDLDSATGELHECAIDVLKNGDGSLSEIRFYDPGNNEWYFNPEYSNLSLYGLYHLLNPFTTSGHFLIRIGAASSPKRIAANPDNVTSPVVLSAVPTVAVHESEERFEDPGISREFIGEEIPVDRDVTIGLPDLPGYTSDSTIIRSASGASVKS